MKTKDDLFLLVQSLDKAEKRYFRLYAKRYARSSNYLRLFDAIARMPVYSEELVKRMFEGEKFAERLAVTKDYLYDMILRSLSEQHEEATPEQQAVSLYRRVAVLVNRRMYAQAERFIVKAKKLCLHYDLFEELLLVMGLEAYLPWVDRKAVFREQDHVMKLYNNNYQCGVFAEQLRIFAEERHVIRTVKDREEVEALLRQAPISSEEEALTFSARLRYLFGYAQYHTLTGDYTSSMKLHRRIVELFHASPQFIATNTLAYISEVRVVHSYQLLHADFAEADRMIGHFRNIRVPLRFVPFHDILLLFMEQMYCRHKPQLDRVPALQQRYGELQTIYGQEMEAYGVDMKVHFTANFSTLYFMRREYGQSLHYVDTLFREASLRRYPAFENDAKILFLILHFELGNTDLLPYIIRSTYRFLLKRERLYAFERCVLRYLRLLASVPDSYHLKQWFSMLHDEVREIASDPVEGNFLRREDYLRWLQEKIAAGRKEKRKP